MSDTPLDDDDSVARSGSASSGLLNRVKAADPVAWGRLVDLYAPAVYSWCRMAHLQRADALDVGQEVFQSVLRSIGDFHRDRPGDSFRGWLWKITQNKIHDHRRKAQQRGQAEGGTDAWQRMSQVAEPAALPAPPEPPTDPPDGLELRVLEMIRASVEPRTWQAFWLVAVECRRPADVAQQLGISVQAVYDARYRIRRRIRQEFADLVDLS